MQLFPLILKQSCEAVMLFPLYSSGKLSWCSNSSQIVRLTLKLIVLPCHFQLPNTVFIDVILSNSVLKQPLLVILILKSIKNIY